MTEKKPKKKDVKEKTQKEKATQIGLHSVKNILGSDQQLSLFSDHKPKDFAKSYGIKLEKDIPKFGIDLTDTQMIVMEAILRGFSETKYEGNLKPLKKEDHAKEKYPSGKMPATYKYVQNLPKMRVTQAELLKWCGIKRNDPASKDRAVKAINHLATHAYCFYYKRLAFNEKGEPLKSKEGDWKKEEVMVVDTLFTVKEVRDERKVLQYYEIIPSTLFLDQIDNYFLLIPYNWREEVRKLVGTRKASSYTFRFLMFLRYQFELNRRSPKQKKPYILRWSPEEISIAIKMPIDFFRRQKKKAQIILEETYSVAMQLGYITKFERTEAVDILYLNEEKYYMPKYKEKLFVSDAEEDRSPEKLKAIELLAFFIEEKKKITSTYQPAGGGAVRNASLRYLIALINQHSFETAIKVIAWGLHRPFWCTRIGTPSKLHKYFSEALNEMNVSLIQQRGGYDHSEENKKVAEEISKLLVAAKSKFKVETFNKYVEIGSGSIHPTCIGYSDKGFKEQLESSLRKWGAPAKIVSTIL